jgi:hypothetical protein
VIHSPPVTVSNVKALNGHCHTRSSTHCNKTTQKLTNKNNHDKHHEFQRSRGNLHCPTLSLSPAVYWGHMGCPLALYLGDLGFKSRPRDQVFQWSPTAKCHDSNYNQAMATSTHIFPIQYSLIILSSDAIYNMT